MKNKKYCFVNVIKDEFIKDYKKLHKNPWEEIPRAIKNAGAKELIIWIYGNLAIIYFECADIDKVYDELGKLDVISKWNATLKPWLIESPVINNEGEVITLEKVFDLGEQLKK